MSIVGRKPKLSPAQQLDLRDWYAQRRVTRRQKAVELGVAESTLGRYLREVNKRPIRQETA